MLDYAVPLMILAIIANVSRSEQRYIISIVFFLISITASSMMNAEWLIPSEYSFTILAGAHCSFIIVLSRLKEKDNQVKYLATLSIVGLIAQAFGFIAWLSYDNLVIYYNLSELIFVAQLVGLFYARGSRSIIGTISGGNDSLPDGIRR